MGPRAGGRLANPRSNADPGEHAKQGSARLVRAMRLLSRRDFVRVQKTGTRASTRLFLVLALPSEAEATRLGVVASKKIGNAVVRNRAKRLVREAYRRNSARITAVLDVVVIARSGAAEATLVEVEAELAGAFERLSRLARPGAKTQSDATNGPRSPRPR